MELLKLDANIENIPAPPPEITQVENYLNSQYEFKYDTISNTVKYKKVGSEEFEQVNENDIYRNLQTNRVKFSLANLRSLLASDFIPRVNPLQEYFDSLDVYKNNDSDYIIKLASYVILKKEDEDRERFNIQFKKMLVRVVACALKDRGYNKHAFILVSEAQSVGKSFFIRWLCPKELLSYYTETLPIGNKDAEIAICENIIINIDELNGLSKTDINQLKSIMSREHSKIRHPYDSKAKTTRRKASFFGSTNKTDFLVDETGSVRWICFEIKSFKREYSSEIDINKIWSQAYLLFKSCEFNYELTTSEIELNEKANSYFRVETEEMNLIEKYLTLPAKNNSDAEFLNTTEIKDYLESKSHASKKLSLKLVGSGLKFKGFNHISKRVSANDVTKGYYVLKKSNN